VKNIRQHVFTVVLVFLSLVAGYITQPSPSQDHCTQDLTCWHQAMPELVKIINVGDVLKNRSQVNDLITKADNIYWNEYRPELSATFSKGQFTVSDLIELLGEPPQVYIVQAFSSETNCAVLYIDYPSKGIMVDLYSEGDLVGVNSGQSISRVMLLTAEVSQGLHLYTTDTYVLEWQGFIDYCDPHDLP
jgi:hypothetical protein